jgi:hypothetical protein
MTEQQAKEKWCPHRRKIQWHDEDGNKVDPPVVGNDINCQCIGSACMMWRLEKDTYGDDYGKDIPDNLGYCGLAGRP